MAPLRPSAASPCPGHARHGPVTMAGHGTWYDRQHVMLALGGYIRAAAQPDGPGVSEWQLNTHSLPAKLTVPTSWHVHAHTCPLRPLPVAS
jgi:hypothetical protein